MAKGKNKTKKNKSLYKSIKASIPKNKVLYSVLGAVGAGLAISSAIGKTNRQALVDKVTTTFKGLKSSSSDTNTTMQPDQNSMIS